MGDGSSRKKGGGITREYVPMSKETERGKNFQQEGRALTDRKMVPNRGLGRREIAEMKVKNGEGGRIQRH